MNGVVSRERWADAQAAENAYWEMLMSNGAEFTRILAEKTVFATWAAGELQGVRLEGDWLEIGVGPLGIGCVHLLPDSAEHTLVGIDPLQQIAADELDLPSPLVELARACQTERYVHVRAAGEETGLERGRFGLAVSYNVLDHVREPAGVLREVRRLLRPGGLLLLGCDTVSWLSMVRHQAYAGRRIAATIAGRAHPFRFRQRDLLDLVEEAGFHVRAHTLRGPVADLLGHAHRLCLLAERSSADDEGSTH